MYKSIKLLISFVFLFFSIVLIGQNEQKDILIDSIFTKDVEISLLTFGAANEPHSVWGHTAIRIKDIDKGIDLVFNYGMFDFDAPFFLIKFLRGKLDYSLAHNKYRDIYRYYKHYKRDMYEQVLNLNYNEKVKLYNLLLENYKEENRFYKYDFFFDNCSTRPLQIIEKSIDGKLMLKKGSNKLTFRQLLNQQLTNHQWMDFGIDLIIGNRADKIPSIRQSTFLPPQLMKTFDIAKISSKPTLKDMKTNKTVIKKLVKSKETILEFEDSGLVLPPVLYPFWVFIIFLLIEIYLFYISYKKKKILYKWYDNTWFILAFIGGLLITFLWFFTDHLATKDNWNYLWLNPLFVFVFLKQGKLKLTLMLVVSFLLFVTFAGFSFIPQQYHLAILPILSLLLLKVSKHGIISSWFKNNEANTLKTS